jgi:hypothetical protein
MKMISPKLKVFVPMKDIMRAQPKSDAKSIQSRIIRLEKKVTKADRELERLMAQINRDGYQAATPSEIQQKNR